MKKRILLFALSALFLVPAYPHASEEQAVVEMKVKRVMLDPSAKTPTAVVILESVRDQKMVPIWIGSEEATSIAIEMENVATPRPNSHDLIRNILQGIGATIHRITITDIKNNIYYAIIAVRLKGQEFHIDSRPSDAIAVALRMKAPIYASAQVLAKATPLPSSEKTKGEFRKIRGGLRVQNLTAELAELFGVRRTSGVLVADVDAGSPASSAGLQRGDVIVNVGGRAVQKVGDLERLLGDSKKSGQIRVEVYRSGKTTPLLLDLSS
ncbi:MAG: bifunctional nuclease family protein [Deltaproteobacteria bacterium]|nr:bifunctional nuclease family protein [Deltaproteobacteria bacterium]